MCHCVVPENIIKKPTIRVTWQVTQIARGSRVLKDQNKSESRLEFPQVSNGKKKKKTKNKNNIITQNNNKNSRYIFFLGHYIKVAEYIISVN